MSRAVVEGSGGEGAAQTAETGAPTKRQSERDCAPANRGKYWHRVSGFLPANSYTDRYIGLPVAIQNLATAPLNTNPLGDWRPANALLTGVV